MFIPVSFMHRKNCLDLGAKVGYHGLRTNVLDWRKSDRIKNNETKNMKTASKEDRDKALNEALAQIQKQFGKGAVMKLGDDSARMNIEAISTGSMSLDLATGIGGSRRAGS